MERAATTAAAHSPRRHVAAGARRHVAAGARRAIVARDAVLHGPQVGLCVAAFLSLQDQWCFRSCSQSTRARFPIRTATVGRTSTLAPLLDGTASPLLSAMLQAMFFPRGHAAGARNDGDDASRSRPTPKRPPPRTPQGTSAASCSSHSHHHSSRAYHGASPGYAPGPEAAWTPEMATG